MYIIACRAHFYHLLGLGQVVHSPRGMSGSAGTLHWGQYGWAPSLLATPNTPQAHLHPLGVHNTPSCPYIPSDPWELKSLLAPIHPWHPQCPQTAPTPPRRSSAPDAPYTPSGSWVPRVTAGPPIHPWHPLHALMPPDTPNSPLHSLGAPMPLILLIPFWSLST